MKLGIADREELLGKITKVGVKVTSKHIEQFKTYGTVVVSANKSVKAKMDKVLNSYKESELIYVSEFDDTLWRLTDGNVYGSLSVVEKGRLFQR